MPSWTYIIVVGFFLLAAPDVFARGFRGGGAVAHRSGPGRQVSIRNPSGFIPAGRITATRTPTTFARIVPARPGLIKVAPIPVFVTPVAPGFHHFGRPFVSTVHPRQNGILIINDVPDVVETTVTIEVAPAIIYPTPQEVVERLLVLGDVKRGDTVYDLGSGDGRVVIAAAKKFGVKAVGFEIDPGLVKLARESVRKQGLQKLVEIRQQDFMTADLSPASVVTLYLSNDGNPDLKPTLMRQLKPGARIVSYGFDMGDWAPKIMETYRDKTGDSHLLYRW